MNNRSIFFLKARKASAAVLIMVGILAAASEGSASVTVIGLAVMAAGLYLGHKVF